MPDEELDLVEMEDDEGGSVTLRVERYFFYNGDEYVLLSDDIEGNKPEGDITRYVMKVESVEGDEDMEEFVPVEDELMERLVKAARVTFGNGGEEEE